MSKTARASRRYSTAKDSFERSETSSKNEYAAKIETLRRKQVRKNKYLANTTRKES